jgi:hypothetical protein
MEKDFIIRRSITIVEGKPHVETYSEQELVRCKDCKKHDTYDCSITYLTTQKTPNDWYCADGERRET